MVDGVLMSLDFYLELLVMFTVSFVMYWVYRG